MYYYVFPATSTTPIHVIHRLATDANFTKIQDSLPAGDYRITVIASHDALAILSAQTSSLVVPFPGGDVFARSYTLTVTGKLNQSVPLERLVNKIHLIVTDQMPTNASRVCVSFYRIPGGSVNMLNYDASILTAQGSPGTVFLNVNDAERGQTNFTRDMYLLSGDSSIWSFNVLLQDLQYQQIVSKNANNIPAPRNKAITIRATLFNGFPSDTGVNVKFPIDTSFKDGGTFGL